VQKVPALLDEVHWLIENRRQSSLLTGPARANCAAAMPTCSRSRLAPQMVPLTVAEVEGLDLERVMLSGLLPPHFLSADSREDPRAYIGDYLKEEIAAGTLTCSCSCPD
jgi:hypothetical protein